MGIEIPGPQHLVSIGLQVQRHLLAVITIEVHAIPAMGQQAFEGSLPLFPETPGSVVSFFDLGFDHADAQSRPLGCGQAVSKA